MAGATATPESIPFVTGTDLDPIPSTFTPVMAQAIHDRLRKRQRYNYDWADSAARIAQTGMEQGSLGYQRNTKTDYIYDNGAWVLQLPYVEFNSGVVGLGDGDYSGLGNLIYGSGGSTSSTAVTTTGGNGIVTVVDPGIYAVTMRTNMSTGSVGSTRIGFSDVSGGDNLAAFTTIYNGETDAYVSNPIMRFTGNNTPLKFWMSKRTAGAANITCQARIARVG